MVRDKKVDIVLIQETKRCCLDEGMIRTIWPWEMVDYMAVDADGSVGGLLSVWNPKIFSLKDYYSNRNLIIVSGISNNSFGCVIINMYTPNEVANRRKVWDSTVRFKSSFKNPWCMGGDFNEIRVIGERKGCLRRDK